MFVSRKALSLLFHTHITRRAEDEKERKNLRDNFLRTKQAFPITANPSEHIVACGHLVKRVCTLRMSTSILITLMQRHSSHEDKCREMSLLLHTHITRRTFPVTTNPPKYIVACVHLDSKHKHSDYICAQAFISRGQTHEAGIQMQRDVSASPYTYHQKSFPYHN
jgi:hypothetical protein